MPLRRDFEHVLGRRAEGADSLARKPAVNVVQPWSGFANGAGTRSDDTLKGWTACGFRQGLSISKPLIGIKQKPQASPTFGSTLTLEKSHVCFRYTVPQDIF